MLAGVLGLTLAGRASAQVIVTVEGDTAHADIALTGANGATYEADVTIVFDHPENLSVQTLNLTAQVIEPGDINPRLADDGIGGGSNCGILALQCPTVDPSFPVMITVEPIVIPWLFTNGFDGETDGDGVFSFRNTYQIDVHTHDLVYENGSPYRLFKAPVGGNFHDTTTDVMAGSVRVRGRGGDFSQFVVVTDIRLPLIAATQKILELNLRILGAALADGLQLDLLALLAQVDTLLLVDVVAALSVLDELIDLIDENAGTEIANLWRATHDVTNDAGEMSALARTLHFSMEHVLGGSANP